MPYMAKRKLRLLQYVTLKKKIVSFSAVFDSKKTNDFYFFYNGLNYFNNSLRLAT